MVLVCTRLNRLIISTLICADLLPPTGMFFETERSVLMILGVRTSVSRRGALPNVPAGAAVIAAGLIQVAVGWSADARRSAKLPEVSNPTPVRFGRFAPAKSVLSLCARPIGKPLCKLMIADAVQPPPRSSPHWVLGTKWRPLPNGRFQIGAKMTRCVTSSTPMPYSDNGSKHAEANGLPPEHAGIEAM